LKKLLSSKRFINIFWLFFEKFGLISLSAASFFAFAYFLTPAQLGMGALILAISEMIGTFFSSVLEEPLVRRNSQSKQEFSSVFWIGGGLAATITLFVGAVFWLLPSTTYLGVLLMATSLSVASNIFSKPFTANLRTKGDFKLLALRTVWGKVSGAFLGVIVAFQGGGEWAFVAQMITLNVVSFWILLRTQYHLVLVKPSWHAFISIVKEGLPRGYQTLLEGMQGRGIVFIISALATPTILGYYSFARRLVDLPASALSAAISSYSVPVFSRRVDDNKKIKHLFHELTMLTLIVFCPFFILLGLLGGDIVLIVFGEKWAPALDFFKLIAFIAAFQLLALYTLPMQVAFGMSKLGLKFDILRTVIALTLSYFMVKKFGLSGIAFVLLFDAVLYTCIRYTAMTHLINPITSKFVGEISKVALISVALVFEAMIIIDYLDNNWVSFIVTLLVLAVSYVLMLWIFFGNWISRAQLLLFDKKN
jgi:O-antigen/teichoic acid export membrane protein